MSAGLQQSETLERLIVEAQYAIRAEPTTHIYTMSGRFVRDVLPLLRALLRQGRAEPPEPEPLDIAPVDHVAYVRDCLADPAVWPRFERPVLQALIDTIDRLQAEVVIARLPYWIVPAETTSAGLDHLRARIETLIASTPYVLGKDCFMVKVSDLRAVLDASEAKS